MVLRSLIHDIWLVGIALQVLLAGVLLSKKTWTKFPFFTLYAAFNLLEAGFTFAVAKNGMLYFYAYWICQAIATILGLAVVYEVFRGLFSHHAALRKIAELVFRAALALLILLGFVVVWSQSSGDTTSIGSVVIVVAEATRVVEVGLLMFLFLFSTAFGLHWRAHIFGIALGLGIFATVDLVNVTLRSHFGNGVADFLNATRGIAFSLSVSMWAAYLCVPERAISVAEMPKRAQLEQWNQAVMELISR
jgi:hypothetical protein